MNILFDKNELINSFGLDFIGIDEAGRGALAGPMMMAACKLHKKIDGLCDSKKLSQKKREELFDIIILNSDYLILEFSNEKIDNLGLSTCLKEGLLEIKKYFHQDSCFIYDGNTNFGVRDIKTQIKADASVLQVSAASILAKVSRDRAMLKWSQIFPHYEFQKHKAYGTKRHKELITQFGACNLHRKSFKLS